MKKKILLIIICLFALVFSVFFTTDLVRAKHNEKPIFAVEVTQYKDGGSTKHVGLFYNVYCIKELNEDENEEYNIYKEVTPWFVSIDQVKTKHQK